MALETLPWEDLSSFFADTAEKKTEYILSQTWTDSSFLLPHCY